MTMHRVMTAALLLGAGACSSQPDPNPRAAAVQGVAAAVASPAPVSSSDPSLPFSAGRAAAPTQTGPALANTLTTAPPVVQTPPVTAAPTFATASAAATAALGTLAGVVGTDPSGRRGFASAAEVTSSALADGLPLLFVRLDSLVAFKAGQDTKALPFDTRRVMYPLTVGGQVRSSVTVQQGADGTWQAVRFGSAPVARASQSIRQTVAAARAIDAGSVSLIQIPTVHATLLSHREKGAHMVTPLQDIPGTTYKAGVTQPAAAVFAALQPLAAKVNPKLAN